MKIAVYSAKSYDIEFLDHANESYGYEMDYFEVLLNHACTCLLATCYGRACRCADTDSESKNK